MCFRLCAQLDRNPPHIYQNGDLYRTKCIRRQGKTQTICPAWFPIVFYSFRKLKNRSRRARNIRLCVISNVVLCTVDWRSLLTPHVEGALSTQCCKSRTLILNITDICCFSHILCWQNTCSRHMFAEVPPWAAQRAAIHGPREYTSWEWPGHLLRPSVEHVVRPTDLLLKSPRFYLGTFHMTFVVDRVALGQVCLRVLRLCLFSIIPPFSTLTLSEQARKPMEPFNKGIQFWILVSMWSTVVLWYDPVTYLWRCFPLQLHSSWLALRDL